MSFELYFKNNKYYTYIYMYNYYYNMQKKRAQTE